MKTGENILPGVGDLPRPLENSWWVIPGKFLAGEYPSSPFRGKALGKLAALAGAGVTTFIDLTEPREGLVPYEPLLERLSLGGIRRLSFPIPDGSVPPSREALKQVLDAVDAALDCGGVLYLHCRGGAGRTGLIAGCWLARQMSSGQDALDRVSELWKGCPKSAEIPETPLNIVQQLYLLCEAVPPAAAPARLYPGDPSPEPPPGENRKAEGAAPRKRWIATTLDRVSLWLHGPAPGSEECREIRKAAEAYVRGLNTLDLSRFFRLLALDVVYTSMWVLEDLKGKEAVTGHLRRKLEAIATGLNSIRVRAELAVSAAGYCAAVSQPPEDPPKATVIFDVRGGLVTGIHVCRPELVPVRPAWSLPGRKD